MPDITSLFIYSQRSNIAFKSCQASRTDKIFKPKIKTTADKQFRGKSFLAVARLSGIKRQQPIFVGLEFEFG